eukprot:1813477-Amphidinium_carterae.1
MLRCGEEGATTKATGSERRSSASLATFDRCAGRNRTKQKVWTKLRLEERARAGRIGEGNSAFSGVQIYNIETDGNLLTNFPLKGRAWG